MKRQDDRTGVQAPGQTSDRIRLECKPTQCTFCLGDDRLPQPHRILEYSWVNKLRDHFENLYLLGIRPTDDFRYEHPVYKSMNVVLTGIKGFKNQLVKAHKISLRP